MLSSAKNPPFLYISFVCVIRFITNRKYVFFITIFTRSDYCHLTIITLIHWIKIDHVPLLMIYSSGTSIVSDRAVSAVREVRGLVGIRSLALWDACWPGNTCTLSQSLYTSLRTYYFSIIALWAIQMEFSIAQLKFK